MTASAAPAQTGGGGAPSGAAVNLDDGKSLLTDVKPDDKAPPSGHPATVTNPPPKDATKPARPDYIPENFWDGEKNEPRVEDLGKAFIDLRSKIARGDHKPPAKVDDYKLPPPPDGLEFKKDDKVMPAFLKAAHEQGLSQAQLDAVLKPVFDVLKDFKPNGAAAPDEKAIAQAREAAAADEMKKLGPQATNIVKNVSTWLSGLVRKGVLGPAEHDGVHAAMTTAEAVRGFSKIMALTMPGVMPMADLAALGTGSLEDGHALLQEGYSKGGESTPEGRELLKKGREILANLERAGALPADVPTGIGVKRAALAPGAASITAGAKK